MFTNDRFSASFLMMDTQLKNTEKQLQKERQGAEKERRLRD